MHMRNTGHLTISPADSPKQSCKLLTVFSGE